MVEIKDTSNITTFTIVYNRDEFFKRLDLEFLKRFPQLHLKIYVYVDTDEGKVEVTVQAKIPAANWTQIMEDWIQDQKKKGVNWVPKEGFDGPKP